MDTLRIPAEQGVEAEVQKLTRTGHYKVRFTNKFGQERWACRIAHAIVAQLNRNFIGCDIAYAGEPENFSPPPAA